MDISDETLERARAVKAEHERELLRKANVVSVGITLEYDEDEDEDEERPRPIIVVGVTEKVSEDDLLPQDRIPDEIEDVSVRVEVVGKPRAQRGWLDRLFGRRRQRTRSRKEREDYD